MSLRPKSPRLPPQPVQPPATDHAHGAKAILQAAAEVDAAGFVEVAHRHRDVTKPEAEVHGLHEELRVKHEIIGVLLEWNCLKNCSTIYAKTTMEIGKVLAECEILKERER